jgi:hypothetical protein
LGVAVLGFGLWASGEVRAGVYNLSEPQAESPLLPPWQQVGNPASPARVWARVSDLILVDEGAQVPSRLRTQYQQQAKGLEQRWRDGVLVPSQRVSLSGCLLRLGRWPQAVAILEEGLRTARPDEPARFLLQLNLAAAYGERDELLHRAVEVQKEALSAWPDLWAGWGRAEWAWYRRVEKYTLDLLRLRQQEALGGRGGANLYPLFPRVRFTGPGGRYEAGAIAFDQWNELPRDAEPVVVQLMLWRPQDPRLDWLYGELLNARGDVVEADKVLFRVSSNRGMGGSEELRQHTAVLRRSLAVYRALENEPDRQKLLWALAPRSVPAAGPASGALDLAWAGAPSLAQGAGALPPPPPEAPTTFRLPDWRVLAVGFVAGVVVALLAAFQWSEWRRRRSRRASRERQRPEVGVPPLGGREPKTA